MYADLDHLGAALLGAALLLASRSPRLLPMLSKMLVAMRRWATAQGALPDRALRAGVYIFPFISILVFIKKLPFLADFIKNWVHFIKKLGFFAQKRPNLARNCHF